MFYETPLADAAGDDDDGGIMLVAAEKEREMSTLFLLPHPRKLNGIRFCGQVIRKGWKSHVMELIPGDN